MEDVSIKATDIVSALQDGVRAINNLNQTLAAVFPQSTGVTGAAGAATGTYLTITAPDGNSYKLALLAIS